MQERVLHLGQHLAEELEHLLPHAWRVLRVRGQDAGREREPRPAWSVPRPRPRGIPPLVAAQRAPSLRETGLVRAASSPWPALSLHDLVITEHATCSPLNHCCVPSGRDTAWHLAGPRHISAD